MRNNGYKIIIELSADREFTDNLKILEVLSLVRLSGISIDYKLNDSRKIELTLDNVDDLKKLMNYLCRSVFIKRIYSADDNVELRLGRGFVINRIPLKRVDTASAPLEPAVSRLLVNLGGVDEGSIVLDPFCGSGGILAEARMCGAEVLCGDLVYRYVKTAKENLDFISEFFVADAGNAPLKDECVNCVVADPPYSRLSIIDEDIDVLYLNFLKNSYRVLKKGCRLVVSTICSLPIEDFGEEIGFEIVDIGFQYVNSTLVRKIVVFRKPE